jgi:hypothetical protein
MSCLNSRSGLVAPKEAEVSLQMAQTSWHRHAGSCSDTFNPRTHSSLILGDGKYESSWKKDFENLFEIGDQAGHAPRFGVGAGDWLLSWPAGWLIRACLA